ncbi:MAG: glyoxalase [Rhodobacterales bacterium]|nr:MAG: glyoxalase [Rhodobacterales bacterium]
MAVKYIEHVQLAMPAGQEGLARNFFGDLLGFTEVPKPANLANRGGCWFKSGNARLHLGVQADFHPATKAHPAFVVDELDTLRDRLDAAGFACKDDEPLEGFRRTYTTDPFGNRIELMEVLE